MAFVSFADASRHVDMSDDNLVRFGTSDGAFESAWSWLTPTGHDLDMSGSGLTYDETGRALTGRIDLIHIDLDNDGGLSRPDVKITGLSVSAPVLDDSAVAFWDAVLNGTDIINAQALSVERVGTSGASYIFGDDISGKFNVDPSVVGDRGGNDVITLGTASVTALGDVRSVAGNVFNNFFSVYEGGNDQILAPPTDQVHILSGDAHFVGIFGTLLGGDDLIQIQSTSASSVAVGDALLVQGNSPAQLARVEGGDDELKALGGSRATLVGDVEVVRSFAEVTGGDDTIIDSDADAGQATRLVGDVFSDQSGGTSSIVGGNDIIHGNGGRDIIAGDLFFGAETTSLHGGNDTLFGGDGDDVIFGEVASDKPELLAGVSGGDDHIFGGAGADRLFGQTGNDRIFGGVGDDFLNGGDGADTLDGGIGFDIASYAGSAGAVDVRLHLGTGSGGQAVGDVLTNIEGLIGSDFADVLKGDSRANLLEGGAGSDNLSGGGGDDTLDGGAGSDTLDGGGGNDLLFGGQGNDLLIGSGGADRLDGGSGRDTASYAASNAAVDVRLNLGTGSGGHAEGDRLSNVEDLIGSDFGDILKGTPGTNLLEGGAGNDDLSAGGGDDTLIGGAGADTMNGGSGFDIASYAGSNAAVDVRLNLGTGAGGHAEGDVLSNIEGLIGSDFGDILKGTPGANLLDGGAGDDNLSAGGGDDTLIGGAGNDTLTGGSGNDRFVFRAEPGSDVETGQDRITDFQGGPGAGDVIALFDVRGFITFTDVQAAATQVGAHTVIDLGGGNTVTLENFTVSNLAADDFFIGAT